jgi:ABC-type amino acid transport substrate-binding protein
MRKILVALMLAAVAAGAFGDVVIGNGKTKTERRSVPAFSSISLGGSGTLRVHRGGQKVKITSDSNLLPYITTTVSGGELKIGLKPFTGIANSGRMQFDVTLPEFKGLAIAGSGDAFLDPFTGDTFKAVVAGSGGIKADLGYKTIELSCTGSGGFDAAVKAGRLDLRCSGSGGAYLRGAADRAEVSITGSGSLGARGFAVGEARLIISGSGEAELRASKSLEVVISGSGSVRYWGKPSISQRVSGSGSISQAGS